MGINYARICVVAGAVALVGVLAGCKTKGNGAWDPAAMTRDQHTDTEFPINTDWPHADIECNQCHGGLPSFKQWSCTSCHEHSQEVLDPIHVGLADYFDDSQCYACHPNGMRDDRSLSRQQHSPSPFPILEGAHADVECLQCHADMYNAPNELLCSQCHQETTPTFVDTHLGIEGFDLGNSTTCYECHPGGTADVDHDKLAHTSFPITSDSTHPTTMCSECHLDPTDRRVLGCSECHQVETADLAGKHFAIDGFDLGDSQSCYTCHPGGTTDITLDREAHGAFPIGAITNHEATECAECHIDPDNRRVLACAQCHTTLVANLTDRHTYVQDFVADNSTTCYNCHPDGATALERTAHGQFPVSDPSNHFSTGCAQCHMDTTDRTQIACAECHTVITPTLNATHTGIGGFDTNDSATCYNCHPGGTIDVVLDRAAHTSFPIAAPSNHQDVQCGECHSDPTDRSQLECSTCHQNITPTLVATHTGIGGFDLNDPQGCYGCHPGGTIDTALDRTTHDQFFPISAGYNHQDVQCAECHADPNNRPAVLCSECHQSMQADLDTAHNPVKGFSLANNDGCKLCHSAGIVPIRISTEHNPQRFRLSSHHNRTCADCHINLIATLKYPAIDYMSGDCYGKCHQHKKSSMDNKHSQVNGYVYDFATCAGCHN